MKRSFCVLMLAVLCITASAQGRWSVKPMAGITWAALTGDDTEYYSPSMGWGGGVEAELRLTRHLGLSMGAVYTRERVKSSIVETFKMRDNYYQTYSHQRLVFQRLNVPILLDIHLVKGLSLKAGFQPNFRLSAKIHCHVTGMMPDYSGLVPGYSMSLEEEDNLPRRIIDTYTKVDMKGQTKGVGCDFPVGASYEWKNVVLDARYHFGFGSCAEYDDASRRYLMVTLGYNFHL